MLHKTGIYFSCSAYCKLQSMTTSNQILNHRSGQAVVLSMALNGEFERSIEWESQFRAHLRNSHPGQCWLAGQKLPIDDSHWIWKGICRKLENGTVLAFRNVFGTEITSSSRQWFLSCAAMSCTRSLNVDHILSYLKLTLYIVLYILLCILILDIKKILNTNKCWS